MSKIDQIDYNSCLNKWSFYCTWLPGLSSLGTSGQFSPWEWERFFLQIFSEVYLKYTHFTRSAEIHSNLGRIQFWVFYLAPRGQRLKVVVTGNEQMKVSENIMGKWSWKINYLQIFSFDEPVSARSITFKAVASQHWNNISKFEPKSESYPFALIQLRKGNKGPSRTNDRPWKSHQPLFFWRNYHCNHHCCIYEDNWKVVSILINPQHCPVNLRNIIIITIYIVIIMTIKKE